jgi:hypothetical protein
MTDQTPSGNRWEPTDQPGPVPPAPAQQSAQQPAQQPTQPLAQQPAAPGAAQPEASSPTLAPPAPPAQSDGPAAGGRADRLRRALARPGGTVWLAGAVAALLVFAGAGGFLIGRASIDRHDDPTQISRQLDHGPFGDDGDDDGFAPPGDGTGTGTSTGTSTGTGTETSSSTGTGAGTDTRRRPVHAVAWMPVLPTLPPERADAA